MEFHKRLEWLARLAFLFFVLASAGFLSAITVIRIAIQGREVIVPDVSGKNLADAQSTLRGRSLGMKVEDRVYSAQPADAVVRQSPPSGVRVKVGPVRARGAEPWAAASADSRLAREKRARRSDSIAAQRIAGGRSFERGAAGRARGYGGDAISRFRRARRIELARGFARIAR